jgi:hypothetical protein
VFTDGFLYQNPTKTLKYSVLLLTETLSDVALFENFSVYARGKSNSSIKWTYKIGMSIGTATEPIRNAFPLSDSFGFLTASTTKAASPISVYAIKLSQLRQNIFSQPEIPLLNKTETMIFQISNFFPRLVRVRAICQLNV